MHHTTRAVSPWLVKRCPRCATRLDGGPVQFYCAGCRRTVFAADLDHEFHALLRRAA
ncbi:hypothetical protein [Nonomuraea cavernae]|uniref:Uncharacterized protein n=1 Tax=Nonomuraea cavernae TaxID=2045107 RepID=A0A918DJ35_9ACTN|nr:hypothetical protein [Nonomuraea cavernae]MCA2186949.1 hypothetical protein [Nonomuraea cavernae]GGO67096.1 hypothetical protein GCM10012289_22700 [Nonomuraea cavernae]